MTLTDKEKKTLLKTRLRNLQRTKAKLRNHAELTDEYFEINRQIQQAETELQEVNRWN